MIKVTRFRTGRKSDRVTQKVIGRDEKSISSWGRQHYDGINGPCGTFRVTLKDNDDENICLHITITEDELRGMVERLDEYKGGK